MLNPPIRYCVDDELARHPQYRIARRITVRLNGTPVMRVISYDCVAGTIERYEEDESGHIRINRRTGAPMVETLKGRVSVHWLIHA